MLTEREKLIAYMEKMKDPYQALNWSIIRAKYWDDYVQGYMIENLYVDFQQRCPNIASVSQAQFERWLTTFHPSTVRIED
jgi:hypothetical protein